MSFLKYQKQNPEFLNNYLKYKAYIEFKSKTTVDETYFDLRTLFRYIKLFLYDHDKIYTITLEEFKTVTIVDVTINDLSNITQNNLEKYIIFLSNTLKNDTKTRNRKLTSAKKFFEYLETNNLISINPARNISSGKIEKRIPKHLSLNESKQLLANTIKSESKFKIRNYAITCLFLNCSLRLSELTAINLTDLKIDNSEQTLKVHGKGNKERIIYLNAAVCEAIIRYLEVRPSLGKDNKDHNALFISGQYKRISNRAVQTIIKNALLDLLEENPYKDKYHTHTLRHTGATLLYNEKDINIFVLKRMLGHECLEATEIYTQVSNEKLKYIMENCTISSIIERNGGQI
jgi:integrase/recombinase XerD